MPDPSDIRTVLATTGPATAWQCLELALAAAQDAGKKALANASALPPSDQFAVALQAAGEALDEIGAAVAAGEQEPT